MIIREVTEFIAAKRVSRLLHRIQKQYVGREVIEVMPNGNEVAGKILVMEWQPSIGLEGDWAVFVEYESGYQSWTGTNVLRLI